MTCKEFSHGTFPHNSKWLPQPTLSESLTTTALNKGCLGRGVNSLDLDESSEEKAKSKTKYGRRDTHSHRDRETLS
ncbi:unnamed protein product [Parnassius apollo]|uniref:(apollo) hypothetical protein n=1 Tax=Parnassius apollo TaxID=110799 RepID=A0A8S3W476_PARAO|nr:unnamed protein product [Parnassius apollo]